MRQAEEQDTDEVTGSSAGEGLAEGAPSAPCLGGPIEGGREGNEGDQPSSPFVDYSTYNTDSEARDQFKELFFVKEIPEHYGGLLKSWSRSRPSLVCHHRRGPEEGAEPVH